MPTSRSMPTARRGGDPTAVAQERGRDARKWVVENVPVGQVSAAKFQLSSHSTRPDQPESAAGSASAASSCATRYDAARHGLAARPALPATAWSSRSPRADGRSGLENGDVSSPICSSSRRPVAAHRQLQSTVPAAMRLLDAEPVALRKATGLSAEMLRGNRRPSSSSPCRCSTRFRPRRYGSRRRRSSPTSSCGRRPRLRSGGTAFGAGGRARGDHGQGRVRVNGVPVTVDVRENTPPVRGRPADRQGVGHDRRGRGSGAGGGLAEGDRRCRRLRRHAGRGAQPAADDRRRPRSAAGRVQLGIGRARQARLARRAAPRHGWCRPTRRAWPCRMR